VFCGPSGERLHRGTPKPVIYTLKGLRESGVRPTPHKLAKPRPVLIPEDFRLHDIRRSVADRMVNELGLSGYVVDVGVLGHAKPKMLGTYAPSVPLKELRAAVETWSGELARILRERPEVRTRTGEEPGLALRRSASRRSATGPGPLRYAARTKPPVPLRHRRP
jgi:hypothetical protein